MHRVYSFIRAMKYRFLSDAKNLKMSERISIKQPVLFSGQGQINIQSDVVFGVRNSPLYYSGYSYIEARGDSSVINIGRRVWVNNNLVIICNGSSISIGDDALIGWNVEIVDSDFHEIDPLKRRIDKSLPCSIDIKSNVWLGSNVKILKGVTIGNNSIVANGSIVTHNIPDNVIAAGIPAIVIGKL